MRRSQRSGFCRPPPVSLCKTDKPAKNTKKAKAANAKGKKLGAEPDETKPDAAVPVKTAAPVTHPLPSGLRPPPALPAKVRAVAVLPVSNSDVGEDIVRGVEHALLSEIDERAPMQSVSPQDVLADMHTYNLDLAKCEGDAECLAQMARYARAHAAIDVQLAFVSGAISLSMRLLDTQTGTQTTAVADIISDDPQARAEEVHRLAVQLLAPDTYVGSLTLVVPEAGTDIYLDDKLVGTAPLPAAFENLHAGPHVLRLSKPGFADLYQFVDVIYNRNATVTVDLRSNTISGAIVAVESKTGLGSVYVATEVAGIEIRIDTEPRGATLLTAAIANVPAGKRRISLRLGELPAEIREVGVQANRRTDIFVSKTDKGLVVGKINIADASAPLPSATPVASAQPVPPKPFSIWQPDWRTRTGLIVGIVGVVSLGAGSYFADQVHVATNEESSIFAKSKLAGADISALSKQLASTNSRGQRDEILQWIMLGAGVALVGGGAGLILYSLFHPQTDAEPQSAQAAGSTAQLLVGPGMLGARLTW